MDVGVGVCCESPTEEGGAQVDGDGREPGQGCTVVQRIALEDCTVVQRTAVEDCTVVQETAVEDCTVVQKPAVKDCIVV